MATEAQLRAIKNGAPKRLTKLKSVFRKGKKQKFKRLQKHTAKRSTHLSTDLSMTQ